MVQPVPATFSYSTTEIKARGKESTKDRDHGQKLGAFEAYSSKRKGEQGSESALHTGSAPCVHESVTQGVGDNTTQPVGTEEGCAQLSLTCPTV